MTTKYFFQKFTFLGLNLAIFKKLIADKAIQVQFILNQLKSSSVKLTKLE